jgi:hypothetical protein
MELAAMKASVEHIREKFAFTERRACRLLLVPVSSYRYQPRQSNAPVDIPAKIQKRSCPDWLSERWYVRASRGSIGPVMASAMPVRAKTGWRMSSICRCEIRGWLLKVAPPI